MPLPALLSVDSLSVTFTLYDRGLHQQEHTVITGLSLDVAAGELVAVVGSSGSGKSLLAHAVLGILPANARTEGEIRYQGALLTPAEQERLRGREIALIPQSVAYLNPLKRVGQQVARAGRLSGLDKHEAARAQQEIFARYGLPPHAGGLFPFQLSGGMARRVLVSTAAIGRAKLLIADEPTPGLHAELVAEAMRHLRQLAGEGRGVLLITHDLEAAVAVADRVAVFYAGATVEVAPAADFQGDGAGLRHPYTRALWQALPQNGFTPLPGSQPTPNALPAGCLFAPRCPLVTDACWAGRPPLRPLRQGRVRCIHAV